MICLLWRQHRGQALWAALILTAFCGLMVGIGSSANHWLAGYHQWVKALADAGCPPPDAHSGDFHVRSAATCQALRGLYPGAVQPTFASRYNFTILVFQITIECRNIVCRRIRACSCKHRSQTRRYTLEARRKRALGRRHSPMEAD